MGIIITTDKNVLIADVDNAVGINYLSDNLIAYHYKIGYELNNKTGKIVRIDHKKIQKCKPLKI